METKIIRGRWNPSQQNTLPVGVPPLEWPPTWVGHDGNEDHSWTVESLATKYPAGRGSTAGMASDMAWFGHDGNGYLSWTMESPPTKYPAGRGSTAGMASDMVGPRWKRRSFVDDGIPPNENTLPVGVPPLECLRHGWATMETDIFRGRWNPPYSLISQHGIPGRQEVPGKGFVSDRSRPELPPAHPITPPPKNKKNKNK